jgi:hypothetical protein
MVRDCWVPEDALSGFGAGEKKPDAVLRIQGEKDVLIELAGKAYSAKRLKAIHQSFASRECPYRIY